MSTRPKGLVRGPQLPYKLLAGIEPCKGGWLACTAKLQGISMFPEPPQILETFNDILDYRPGFEIVAMHIPIGLPAEWTKGGRTCDQLARKLLGPRRGSAIISPPPRVSIDDPKAPGVSAVTRSLLPKIREVHKDVASYHQRQVYEVHPELGFYQINKDQPLKYSKRTQAGVDERTAILKERVNGFDRIIDYVPAGIDLPRILDATANLWTARRLAARAVSRLPESPEWNEDGLRMELVR